VAVLRVADVEHHGGLMMVEPMMVPGIAMMDFVVVVVVVLPNSVGQMDLALGQGCLFERSRRRVRVMISPPCLMFVGRWLLPAAAFLGN